MVIYADEEIAAMVKRLCEVNGGEDEARRRAATVGVSLEMLAEAGLRLLDAASDEW